MLGLGLRAETHSQWGGFTPMRLAAAKAGLGIIRNNNFFYTDKGSSVQLEAWLIDREIELYQNISPKPCPEKCGKCLKACPTGALIKPFSMNPTKCVTYLTTSSGVDFTVHPCAGHTNGWIYGCDACQDACPFNKKKATVENNFLGLEELVPDLSLIKILEMDYEELKKKLAPIFWYIPENRLWQWKVNVLNAMNNNYLTEYKPFIEKAFNDPEEQVQSMARHIAQKHF